MILSSNSDEVANQLGALAANKQFTASLVGLLARDQYTSADDAERRLILATARAKATAGLVTQMVEGIPDSATAAEAEQKLVAIINVLAADLGHDGTFPNLDEAAKWLEINRGRLLRSER
jgi:hypothetical protein